MMIKGARMTAAPIESILHRRTDLSTFLVHFTRDYDGAPARSNLLDILTGNVIEARHAFSMARDLPDAAPQSVKVSQNIVSLSETPLEHAWSLCGEIEGREHQLKPYGVAFTKAWARLNGCNPVWYLDITPGSGDWLTTPIDSLIKAAKEQLAERATRKVVFANEPLPDILKLTPFIEQMGPMNNGRRKEFAWEREWRHVGDLPFATADLVAVFVPEGGHAQFRTDYRAKVGDDRARELALLDPTWGLDQMIAALADVNG